MNDLKQLLAEAEIGEAARAFVESELGQAVLGMAKQEVMAAMVEFEDVDPGDVAKIRELQLKMKFGRRFDAWLIELITKGQEALEAFKQYGEKN